MSKYRCPHSRHPHKSHIEVLYHPSYSPDLALPDYYLSNPLLLMSDEEAKIVVHSGLATQLNEKVDEKST